MAVVFLYNAEIKEQFFDTLPKTAVAGMRWQFQKISDTLEEPLQKDLSESTIDEIRVGMRGFDVIDVQSARTIIGWLCAYNRWAHETHQDFVFTDAIEDFDERTDIDYTVGVKRLILPSPEVLVSTVTRLYPIDEGYEVLPALIFAWLGLTCPEAVALKKPAVDFETRKLTMPNGIIYPFEIPEVFWEPLEVYANTRVATRFVKTEFPVFADDLGFFIKKMLTRGSKKVGKPYTAAQIAANITTFAYKYDETFHERPLFTYTTIMKSGMFWRLYQLEQSGIDLYAKTNRGLVDTYLGKKSFLDVMTVYEAYRKVFYPRDN